MANKKISELSAAGALAGTELVEVVKGGVNVQTTTQDIADLGGGGGGGTWGSITGTLSSQTDLQNALNDKADSDATYTSKAGAYTMAAAELTILNAGGTLEMVSTGGGALTFPNNATLAIPVGKYVAIRGFASVVADGGGGADTWTGTNGTLDIESGTTAVAQKIGTTSWILHNGSAASSGGDTLTSEGALINSATSKATPVDADMLGLMDSEASNILKKLSWANAKATLKTYFDTLYTGGPSIEGIQDIFIPASAMHPRITGGCAYHAQVEFATSAANIVVLDFDQTAVENAQFTYVFPRNWDRGVVKVKFYFLASSGSGDVVWSCRAGAYSNGDALTTALGTMQSVTKTLTATGQVNDTAYTSNITIAGVPADGDVVVFQVQRTADDGADTLNADARLIGIVLSFTLDAATAE